MNHTSDAPMAENGGDFKLEEAGYVSSEKTRNGSAPKTTVVLTSQGRAALDAYTRSLRDLLSL